MGIQRISEAFPINDLNSATAQYNHIDSDEIIPALPKTLSDQSFREIPVHGPLQIFFRDGHAEPAMVKTVGNPEYGEKAIDRSVWSLENPTKGLCIRQAPTR